MGMTTEQETQQQDAVPACRTAGKTVEVDTIPLVLVWAIGAVALLMLLVGGGVLLLRSWDSLQVGVRVGCLLLPVLLMWGGYGYAARRGFKSTEVAGAFACITWLIALLVWSTLCPATPRWMPGAFFVVGTLLVALWCPNRTSVVMLAVASVAEMGMLWYGSTGGGAQPAGALWWCGGLTLLCLWGLGGFLCKHTRHVAYAPYAFLGPLMFSVYLLALQGVIMYVPPTAELGWGGLCWVALMWLLPAGVFCALHRMLAVSGRRQLLSVAFLSHLGAMYAVVPLGIWGNQLIPMVPGVILLFVYAVCMVRYGAYYRSSYFVVAGCALVFLVALGIAFGHGGSLLGGGLLMLLSGAIFAWLACRLYVRRRRLCMAVALAEKKQRAGTDVSHH